MTEMQQCIELVKEIQKLDKFYQNQLIDKIRHDIEYYSVDVNKFENMIILLSDNSDEDMLLHILKMDGSMQHDSEFNYDTNYDKSYNIVNGYTMKNNLVQGMYQGNDPMIFDDNDYDIITFKQFIKTIQK
jgi:hypothetical protein